MKEKIKFIQIGTSVANDDVYDFIKDKDIELGVLIEPMKEFQDQIKECYKDIKNIHLEQVAISSDGKGEKDFYHSKKHLGIGTFVREHLPTHKIEEEFIKHKKVQCVHIHDIFKKYGIEELDYLFIDTEGHDFDILLSLDFDKYKIKQIVYEDIHIDGPQRTGGPKTSQLLKHLISYNYSIKKTHKFNSTATLGPPPLTHCISTHNNLPYLKLAIASVRENSFFRNTPFIIHAENCTDGTDEWLEKNASKYNLEYYIDKNDNPKGIGGGMNFCADKVKTKYINFLHSDFYVSKDWDLLLMDIHYKYKDYKLWVNSFRIEPNMFNSPDRVGTWLVDPETFGGYHDNFNAEYFLEIAEQFSRNNNQEISKGEGVSGLVTKEFWDEVGGNDPIFAPTSWDDMDLFLRWQQKGGKFIMPTKSVVYHFGARGSHRLEENNGKSSERQLNAERANAQKFFKKWGGLPLKDENDMIIGIK